MDMVIATELVQHDYGTETNSGFEWNGKAGSNQETGMIPVDESLSRSLMILPAPCWARRRSIRA